jgi:hypothetical protein
MLILQKGVQWDNPLGKQVMNFFLNLIFQSFFLLSTG